MPCKYLQYIGVTRLRLLGGLCDNFMISLFSVCVLLGISPASDCDLPTFRNPLSVPSPKAGCRILSGW
jgi:hypothetical protein